MDYWDPVVPMYLALYGHPDSGGYWEEACEKSILECGWVSVEGWRSTFWHPKEKALLVVYVDDFKMAAPSDCMNKLWTELKKKIKLGDVTAPDRFLGCYLEPFETKASSLASILGNKPELYPRTKNKAESMKAEPAPLSTMKDYDPERTVRGYVYNMEQYLDKNIGEYCEVAKVSLAELKKVDTPFIDEAKDP